jgi:hypothetical protein
MTHNAPLPVAQVKQARMQLLPTQMLRRLVQSKWGMGTSMSMSHQLVSLETLVHTTLQIDPTSIIRMVSVQGGISSA